MRLPSLFNCFAARICKIMIPASNINSQKLTDLCRFKTLSQLLVNFSSFFSDFLHVRLLKELFAVEHMCSESITRGSGSVHN